MVKYTTPSSAIIIGLARDAGKTLPDSLECITRLQEQFIDSYVIIGTNDNSDRTEYLLRSWVSGTNNRELLLFDGCSEVIYNRIDRLATVRNLCLAHARRIGSAKFDCLIVVDLDGPIRSLDAQASMEIVRQTSTPWDALFSNQKQAYYDIYALRHPEWCPGDCWQEISDAQKFPFRKQKRLLAISRYIHQRQYLISPEIPPVEVHSAFGGLGIYRMAAIERCWYGSRDEEGRVICEHVVFHRQMRSKGARLYILPSLLTEAPIEYLGIGSGAPFPGSYA